LIECCNDSPNMAINSPRLPSILDPVAPIYEILSG
jgi:hypothetical protein